MSEETAFKGILVAAYVDEGTADDVLDRLKEAKKDKTFQYWDAVVIRKDVRGRYYYNESKDMSTPIGAGIGAVIGGLIGLPGGPADVVLGTGLGAALGGFAADSDRGIRDDRLEDVGYALMSGNSALLVVSDHDYLRALREYSHEQDAHIAVEKLTMGISENVKRGQNIAYTITSAGRSVSCHELDSGSEIAKLLGVEKTAE